MVMRIDLGDMRYEKILDLDLWALGLQLLNLGSSLKEELVFSSHRTCLHEQ